jgi:integrin beta 1
MDYPSIAQLNQRAIQNSINIIFAVTANQAEIYNKLSSRIEGAKSGMISQNSSNIVDLVEQEYRVKMHNPEKLNIPLNS